MAPRAATDSAWVSSRTRAATSCPCLSSSVSTCDPMNPVAPVSATFMLVNLLALVAEASRRRSEAEMSRRTPEEVVSGERSSELLHASAGYQLAQVDGIEP